MISWPLLKQSIKSNGLAWVLITIITAFMLGILIFVLGSIDSNEIRNSLSSSFVKSEIDASLKGGAIQVYTNTYDSVDTFYVEIKETYDGIKDLTDNTIDTYEQFLTAAHPNPRQATIDIIIANTPEEQTEFTTEALDQILNFYLASSNPNEHAINSFITNFVKTVILDNLVNTLPEESQAIFIDFANQIIAIYSINNELTDQDKQNIAKIFVDTVFYNNLDQESPEITEMLESFGFETMYELLDYYGYTKASVDALASSGIIQYTSYINSGYEPEDAYSETTKSLMNQMPEEVSESLLELSELDINNLVIGSIFYKIAGLLLPIVYVITTANNLIAGQVDSGSMAYVLSTPTKRRKVTFTQMFYLVGSLIAMYLVIGGVGFIAAALSRDNGFSISNFTLFKLNIGALVTMIAISGVCFLASSWFNRSKHSMGIGGGISMFFLVSTILGLFGSGTVPQAMRIEAMNSFNYTTIISLFDTEAILDGGSSIYGILILLGIALITYTIGILKFEKKDLPL